jgi:hypothetical protein
VRRRLLPLLIAAEHAHREWSPSLSIERWGPRRAGNRQLTRTTTQGATAPGRRRLFMCVWNLRT